MGRPYQFEIYLSILGIGNDGPFKVWLSLISAAFIVWIISGDLPELDQNIFGTSEMQNTF
jgi:hypothetical protein